MKIIIFGAGRFYQERKSIIPPEFEIVAFFDNNPELQGQSKDGLPIMAPEKFIEIAYDKIVLMSASEEAMKNQLLELGVDRKDIWYWERFFSEIHRGAFRIYCSEDRLKGGKKRILIISTYLNYTGGPLAAVYAVRALQDRGYVVFLAAPDGDRAFMDEVIQGGINVVLCPSLPYIHKEEMLWIRQFDVVLVNVFPMISCACKISEIKPVLWWIHESEELLYKYIMHRFDEYAERKQLEKVHICAVSQVAQRKFNMCFPDRIKELLPYGIPDKKKNSEVKKEAGSLVFAIIGTVHPGKAQDVFVKAISLLQENEKKNTRFLIIGPIGMDEYGGRVIEGASKESVIKITGLLTRSEIEKIYEEIDVVVCPSLEDSLPIVITEGMMYGKVCIVSDAAGTADYIQDGKNGFICKAGNPMNLCEKMRWIIANQDKLEMIGNEARKVYEKYFEMDMFGGRMEKALQETMEKWREK